MNLSDRQTFEWRTADPVSGYEFAVISDRPFMAEREYAIAVTAYTANGDPVDPLPGPWKYSTIIGTHYHYVPQIRDGGGVRMPVWRGVAETSYIEIHAIYWDPSDEERANPTTVAITSVSGEDTHLRRWEILYPSESGA